MGGGVADTPIGWTADAFGICTVYRALRSANCAFCAVVVVVRRLDLWSRACVLSCRTFHPMPAPFIFRPLTDLGCGVSASSGALVPFAT